VGDSSKKTAGTQLNGEIVTRSMTGHVTEAMTEHYSHVGREEKLAAVGRIAQLVALPASSTGGSGGGSDATEHTAQEAASS
jgi:hypothetical protein